MEEKVEAQRMHILLAEDSDDIRTFYAGAFATKGHSVREARNGVEAVAAVEREAFDLILLDVHMPLMDGWEALRRITKLPHGRAAIIALLSAAVAPRELTAAEREGASAVFHKPIMPNAILTEVQRLMDERTAPTK